jgi:hypothetical protein
VDIADLPEDPSIGAVSHNSDAAILITWCGEPKSSWFPLSRQNRNVLFRAK